VSATDSAWLGMDSRRLLGPLAVRLSLIFVAVALGAIALLAVLTLVAAEGDVSSLITQQHRQTTSAVASAVSSAYAQAGSWAGADLDAARALAAGAEAQLTVRDAGGRVITAPPATKGHPPQSGPIETHDVVVGSGRVGTLSLSFPGAGLPPARQLRSALVRTVATGAGLAAVLAVVVAVFVSRRISRPVASLTAAARAMERGQRETRADTGRAPGELEDLAVAFNRMADSLSREDALRRALVADVAHELRTPLTILQASTEALVDGVEQPSPARLSYLHDEVLRLGRLVEDLETLASAEAADLRLQRRDIDLSEISSATAESLRPRFDAAGVRLEVEGSRTVVNGDQSRMAQVVTNLLTNAVKFTPSGGEVLVDVHPEDGQAVLQVTDTGVGIPQEDLGNVFVRFWRGTAAEATEGSGIGLAVVAELVRAHGGRVEASNRSPSGSRFTVTLPLSDSTEPAPAGGGSRA
jgi:two-component system sensor histidine kinase BaeS